MSRQALMAVAMLAVLAADAGAQDYASGGIVVSQPWARATARMAKSAAAYMTITARGAQPDRLLGISTPVAGKAELHQTDMRDNIMRMQRVASIEVRPGAALVLRPGGMHIMLMGLAKPLGKGQTFPMTLTFEKAGALTLEVAVRGIGAKAPAPPRHR